MDDRLRRVFQKYIHQTRGGRPIGRQGTIRVSFFLDLLSAAHVPEDLGVLADVFVAELLREIKPTWDLVVGPKRGNCLFVKAVADRLRLRTSFVRDGIVFGRWVEGPAHPGDKVLLVDDVGSAGELLAEAVENLRKPGIYVDQAWVLVNRHEGDTEPQLRELGTQYRYVYDIDDEFLGELRGD